MTNKKFKIATLGCRTNQYESAAYTSQLTALGYAEALASDQADVCIVNTCTVTHAADSDSRQRIRELQRKNPGAAVVVTGCLAESLQGMEGVKIVPNSRKEALIEELFPDQSDLPEFKIDQFAGHTRAFVKVQDGCNSFCTYCIIPYVRGRSKSRPLAEILDEVRTLIANGYKEIVLTGINIGDFENEGNIRLVDLVRAVDQLEGLERLRVSSIDPDEVDEALAEAILNGKKTCHSMHIVLQSGSNAILKRMNRKYTRQIFLDTVEKLKTQSPDFTVTTDVIVGFPGERECDFQDTLEIMDRVKFAKVHMFPYSVRARTRAALYPDKVSHDEIGRRKQLVLRAAEKGAFELRQKYVGREMRVLTESGSEGHTDNFLTVLFPGQVLEKNRLVTAKIIENSPRGLIGKVVS